MGRRASSILPIVAAGMLLLCTTLVGVAQKLDENCTVSVLNRTVRVNPDGSWVLPNVPANFGQVKARATCVKSGVTTFGESGFFAVAANGAVNIPPIILGSATQIPSSLTITPAVPSLTAAGQTTQLLITAKYPDNSTQDVTAASSGTNYTTSNAAIATVSANGLVTAVASGTVVIQATNDGATGIVAASVVLSSADSDGDGIPDDAELRLGLDPHNPVDAQEDLDRDDLTNLREYSLGTDIRKADTDEDGLSDGDEVNTHHTNALLSDTDGDLIPDGVEIQNATNPVDGNSYDLMKATASSVLKPSAFVLTTSVLFPIATQQLSWKVNLIDGKTLLDLTADPRTNYSSSDTTICNFGGQKGLVFAGNPGNCTITISNNTLSVTVSGTVKTFTPAALSFVDIPGFANNVDVSGNFAYVAAGSAGLQVLDVSDRQHPRIVASHSLPGNANDVMVVGDYAYVASGSAGLQIVNISNPLTPTVAGSLSSGSVAWDVVVKGDRAYLANGAGGLVIIKVSDPSLPVLLGSLILPGTSKGVDVDAVRQIATVALGTNGLAVVNIANPATPALLGSLAGGDVRDVAISGNYVFLADMSRSFTSVDLTNPATPVLRASTQQSLGGLLQDVTVNGSFAAGADVFFVNGVPLIDVSTPASPQPRIIIDFRAFRDDNGTGIAMDSSYVYLTGSTATTENGATGTTRLYIGQYRNIQDNLGNSPTVQITSPASGSQVVQGSSVTVTANATDDVAVASVSFMVNGQAASTTTTAPYQFTFTASTTDSTVIIGATAADFGNNVGQAPNITLNLIPDPGTTVTGKVIDRNSNPVEGATVTATGNRSATTAADGSFSVAGVQTILGNISVTATITISGKKFSGRSGSVAPVLGGTTNVGDIIIRPGQLFGSSPSGNEAGTNPNGLFLIDTTTGLATLIGTPANVTRGLSDVSFDPATGTLYAMHGSATKGAELLTLDPVNAHIISRVTVSDPFRLLQGSDALAHDFAGTLFAGGWSTGRLLKLNPANGVVLSDLNITNGDSNNHLADLAVDPVTGSLWATRGNSDGGGVRLIIINPTTGAITFGFNPATNKVITAIAFDNEGNLFAALDGDQLAKIDKSTGAITLIGTGFGGPKIAGLGFQH